MTPHISVVSPVYKCCPSLIELCNRLKTTLSSLTENFEIIFVNDGSPDDAWQTIRNLCHEDKRVKGINLSRNFGQHYAISAGINYANGDWVVVMDCDLQDVPEEITKLYLKAQSGYDLVVGLRTLRQDAFFKIFLSKIFFNVFSFLTNTPVDSRIGNFGIYSQKVISSIRELKDHNQSFGFFALWVGFHRAEIDIQHSHRPYGKSGYSFSKLMNLAVMTITTHSNKILHMIIKFGLAISLLSFFSILTLIFCYAIYGFPFMGLACLISSIYFAAGLVMCAVGVIGLYVGNIFNEVKNRPLYIIESTTFPLDEYKK